MKFLSTASKLAFVGLTQLSSHRSAALLVPSSSTRAAAVWGMKASSSTTTTTTTTTTRSSSTGMGRTRLFSSSGGSSGAITLKNIGMEEMKEIIEDYENGGREDSGYVILDVREPHEIAFTGSLSPNTINFPLQKMAQLNAYDLEEDEFEEAFGFAKPQQDETLVFTCAAGIRSVHAAQYAAQFGYSQLINYRGGANEWFMY